MPLTELIIDGFKSFADKTTIHFNQGITGIVGPNGSGKSNITEALRWVMGESRIKSLRGDNMKDVIFAGSQFRKPMNRAEVTLIFDNRDRQLKFDSDQVAVTRRLLRSGDSEYLINKQQVRQKDVRELFLDSGLSQNSLAIISQGRVDQILNSKPEDRRFIFEEAAGVLHFKNQKESAANQLAKTSDNLIRINDIVKELEKQLEPLHEESSLAKEYLFQKNKLDHDLKILLALEIEDLAGQKSTLKDKADKNQLVLNKLDAEVKQSQTAVSQKRDLYESLRQKHEDLQKQLLEISNKLSDLNTELQISNQSKQFDQATQNEYQKQIVDLQAQLKQLHLELETFVSDEQKFEAQRKQLQDQRLEILGKLEDDPESLNQNLEDERNNYIQLLQDQTSNNNELVYLKTELKRAQEDRSYKGDDVSGQLEKAKAELAKLEEQGSKLKTQRQKTNSELTNIASRLQKKQADSSNLKSLVNNQRGKLQQLTARQEALVNIQKRHEGYYYGVRNILNHLEEYPGVIGVVGELLSFPNEYEAAMTTALGSSVQNLVTDNRESARDAINRLKQNHAGRATFLPLDALRQYEIPASTITSLQSFEGFIGIASDLVTNRDADISVAINYLLANVIIVDKIETAMAFSSRINRYRIVTLDGDVISPGGSMTGGMRNERSNSPLQTMAEISKLTELIENAKKQLEIDNTSLADLELELEKLASKHAQLNKQLLEQNQAINSLAISYQSQDKEVKRLSDLVKLYNNELQERQAEIDKLLVKQEKLTKQQVEFERLTQVQKDKISQIQLRIKDFTALNQKLQLEVGKIDPQIAVYDNKLENINKQKRDKQKQVQALDQQLTKLKEKFANLTKESQLSGKRQAEIQVELKSMQIAKTQLEEQLADLSSELGQTNAQINSLDQVASRNYELRKDVAIEQEEYSVKLAKINSQMMQKLDLLSQEYALTYEAAKAEVELENTPENRADLHRRVKLCKMSIEEIGPVNLKAIDDYKNIKSRYEFLSQQQSDLLSARKNLEESMKKLDQEVEKRFMDTFNNVADSFSQIFPIVFGGGSAKLLLTEPDNPLETGIEIIAEPPGKKLQRLSLLSGGERALTAITLLFAMIQISPVPFCVLDEVEAALDDANVTRFGKFLKRYDLKTQFIVITHRHGTMEEASQLFGVVMQESGVSQVLSVSLKDLKDEVE